jgi:hypothetical protein
MEVVQQSAISDFKRHNGKAGLGLLNCYAGRSAAHAESAPPLPSPRGLYCTLASYGQPLGPNTTSIILFYIIHIRPT